MSERPFFKTVFERQILTEPPQEANTRRATKTAIWGMNVNFDRIALVAFRFDLCCSCGVDRPNPYRKPEPQAANKRLGNKLAGSWQLRLFVRYSTSAQAGSYQFGFGKINQFQTNHLASATGGKIFKYQFIAKPSTLYAIISPTHQRADLKFL